MARDVDFNVTANDKTGSALSAAARRVEETNRKMKADADKTFGSLSRGMISAAARLSPALGEAVTKGFASAAPAVGPALAAAVVGAAPMIGAAVSAAVVGGVGVGGVLGGVALAARNSQVQAAGKTLGDNLMSSLQTSASPFIAQTLEAIGKIGAGFDEVRSHIDAIFSRSSQFLAPLTDGAIKFGQALIRGIDRVSQVAGPVIDAISHSMDQLGQSVESFMVTVAGDGQGAAAAVRSITDAISGTLAVLGPVIAALSKIVELMDSMGVSPGLLQAIARMSELGGQSQTMASAAGQAAAGILAASTAAGGYAASLQSVYDAQRKVIGDNVSLYQAQTQAAAAFAATTEAIKKNGEGLSRNTAEGRANRDALGNLANSLNTAYEQYVKVHGAGQQANAVLAQNRSKFLAAANQAGVYGAKAERLADQLVGIPSVYPKVEVLDKATGKINNVINRLAAVRSKTVNLTVAVRQSGDASALRKQSMNFSASTGAAYAAAAPGGGRVGGPQLVNVQSDVVVNLDGRPFADATATALHHHDVREAFWQRVGSR